MKFCGDCKAQLDYTNSTAFKVVRGGQCRLCSANSQRERRAGTYTARCRGAKARKQVPGKEYTFVVRKTGDILTGILPVNFGESNDFVKWQKSSCNKNRGCWVPRLARVLVRRADGVRERIIQKPGAVFTFRNKKTGEEVTGALPSSHGQSNEFAYWCKIGCWKSGKFIRDRLNRITTGKDGLLELMRYRVRSAVWAARRQGYKPPNTTPEMMIIEWEKQAGKCAACGGVLGSLIAVRNNASVHYEHCHETGKVRGFVHKHCNFAEAAVLKMTDGEMVNFIEWIKKIHNRSL